VQSLILPSLHKSAGDMPHLFEQRHARVHPMLGHQLRRCLNRLLR